MKNLRGTLLFVFLVASAGLAGWGCADDNSQDSTNTTPDTREDSGGSGNGKADSIGGGGDDTEESDTEEQPDADPRPDTTPGEPDVESPDADTPDTGDQDTQDPGGVFAEITTAGAELSGDIGPQQTLQVKLSAERGDIVVMWLKKAGSSTWNPSLSMYRANSDDALVYSTPLGGVDAHIPYQDDRLDDGWNFDKSGEYRLELANTNPGASGEFEFTLECLGGPCARTNPDPDGLYAGLSDAELIQAIRQDHAGHQALSYDAARDFIFEYNIEENNGRLKCHYTGREVPAHNRREGQAQGFDTEHTWPQSKGAGSSPARTDMHHLWPIDSNSNSRRSNYDFDNVVSGEEWSEGGSKLGLNANGDTRFEVRDDHKGNVARAYFYFSVIYDYPIDDTTEATLRQWHVADPPDESEKHRNNEIEALQHSRNPFIDAPELVDRIADF